MNINEPLMNINDAGTVGSLSNLLTTSEMSFTDMTLFLKYILGPFITYARLRTILIRNCDCCKQLK